MRYIDNTSSSALLLVSLTIIVVITTIATTNAAARPNMAFISPSSSLSSSSSSPSPSLLHRKSSNPSTHRVLVSVQVPPKSKLKSTSNEEEIETEEEKAFKLSMKQLCEERNLPFQKIKNARDLHSVKNSPVRPGRIIRTGAVSDASEHDVAILNSICGGGPNGATGIKTYVDLRSYTELKDDPVLDNPGVFANYTDYLWVERKGGVKVLNAGRSRVEKKSTKRSRIVGHVKELVGGAKKGIDVATHFRNETEADGVGGSDVATDDGGLLTVLTSAADLAEATDACNTGDCGEKIDTVTEEEESDESITGSSNGNININKKRFAKVYHSLSEMENDESRSASDAKERHFVPVMNEVKYAQGTLGRVQKRDLAKIIIKSPGAIASKRVRLSCKDVFYSRINEGGLHLMNEVTLKYGAAGIRYVLNLCKDRNRHPIAFYCTAGKDRTGIIAAIILAAAGVPDEDIIEDYCLSANVYAEINDHKAKVGALNQRNLDAKTFLSARPEVMRDTLNNIRSSHGSIEAYMDSIGFNEEDRKQLRSALLND